MDNQPWLDDVRQRLAKQALPPIYAQRFMEELSDHLTDLTEENMETDACSRLGEPEQVAEAAATAYRRRSFLGRHPTAAFLVFAISPVIPHCVLMFLGVLVLATVSGNRPFEWYEHQGGLSLSIVVCSIFLSILYGELAMWLGIGKKWTLTSCAVLGANAMFWESFGIPYAVTVMLPVQFAAPFAVGWWFTKRQCSHRYAATAFLVFAISPVALYTLLSLVALSTAAAVFAWSSVFGLLLMFVVPTALASLLYRKLAKGVGSGRKWLVVSCLVLATCAAIPFVPLLLMFVVPMVLASLLYCKLARRSGIGWKWMLVSCTVLAVYAATQSSQGCHLFEYYDTAGQYHFCVGLWTCITLIQLAVPLVVGWRFMRREHDQGQLQLAC